MANTNGKKVQVPVLGGLRKVIRVGGGGATATTLDGFSGQTLTIGQLRALLGLGAGSSSQVTPGGGGGGGGASAQLVPGPGLAGGGPIVGSVPIRLIQPIPAFIFDDGGGEGEDGPPGVKGSNGAAGAGGPPGPRNGPAVYAVADEPEAEWFPIQGNAGPRGATGPSGSGGTGGGSSLWLPYGDEPDPDAVVWVPGQTVQKSGGVTPTTAVPLTIPDLQFWFDATQLLAGTGSQIRVLQNKHPGLYTISGVGSGVGVVGGNTLNGKQVVTFPGSADGRYNLPTALGYPEVTVFVVHKPSSLANTQSYISGGNGAFQFWLQSTGTLALVRAGQAILVNDTTTLSAGVAFQANARMSSTAGTYAFRVASTASSSGSISPGISNGSGGLAFDPASSGEDLTGDLGEFILYQRALTLTEVQSVEAYLLAKWGV